MIFGKRSNPPVTGKEGGPRHAIEPELYVVGYDSMLKGNKVLRKGKPIRQVAIVVDGTVRLVTSGDRVDRRTYDALIGAGVLPPPAGAREQEPAPLRSLPDLEEEA